MDNDVRNKTEIYERPGWGERISYGMSGLGLRLVTSAIGAYLLVYYTNVAMLDIAVISAIIAASKFLDGVSDMLIGHVVDNTRSRLGKARIWLLRMCLPFALSTVMLFWVPAHLPDAVKYIYVFLMYNLVNAVFFTFMQISQLSLISLMSADEEEHGLLGSIQALGRNIGILIGNSLFVKLLELFTSESDNQNTQRGYTGAVMLLCIVMVLLTLVSVFFVRERVSEDSSVTDGSIAVRPKMLQVFSILLKEKYWRVILICEMFALIATQTNLSAAAYFAMYVLKDMNAMSWMMAASNVPGIVVLLVSPFLIRKVGKHRLFIAGLAAAVSGLIALGLATPDVLFMIPGMVVQGAGRGLLVGMMFGIVADIISETKDKTGQFIAGVGNAGLSAVDKIGMGLGTALFGLVFSASGFDASLDAQGIAQSASVISAANFMFIWFPAILFAIALIVYLLFFDMYRNKRENGTKMKTE